MNDILNKYYNEEVLIESCNRYGIDYKNAELIRSNSNLIFDCGDKILRLSHSTIRTIQDIEVELDWMRFLRDRALPVVRIIKSESGEYLERTNEGENYFTIVCLEKIEGTKVSKEYWNENHFQNLGKITGQFHRIGNEYQQKTTLAYKDWDEIPEFDCYKYLPEDDRALKELHDALVMEFKTYPKNNNNYGLIHYDIHHGNYLMVDEGKKIMVFDFEMTCRSWFVNDVSAVLYYASNFPRVEEATIFEDRFLAAFWKGYEKEQAIEASEKKKIPKFLLYRDLMIVGFLNNIWAQKTLTENDQNFINRLNQSLDLRRKKLEL